MGRQAVQPSPFEYKLLLLCCCAVSVRGAWVRTESFRLEKMGAEKENFWSNCGTSHPSFLTYLWYLLGICISQSLPYVQEMGKQSTSSLEHLLVVFPGRGWFFFSLNGLFYRQLHYTHFFGCFMLIYAGNESTKLYCCSWEAIAFSPGVLHTQSMSR